MFSRSGQRGFSLLGMLFFGCVIAVIFVVAAQIFPTVVEYQAIGKASKKAAGEGASVAEVRSVFDRAAAVDNISSISGKDLGISKDGNQIVVSFSYEREIHLVGPAYLLLRYEGRSN
jgi:Domain of unknown function (DUF4845)